MGAYKGKAAAVAFVRDADSGIEVYLSRRPRHFRYYPGSFVFPGGREDQEDPSIIATACREILEEIGVQIDPIKLTLLRETFTSAHAGPVYHMFIFAYPVLGSFDTSPNPDEIDEEIWVTAVEALANYDLPYQTEAAVRTVARFSSINDLFESLKENAERGRP